MKRPGPALFVASVLGLFVELALIRWIPNTVHIVGFFANLVLIGSFLGLGIGMARPLESRRAANAAAIRLSLLVGFLSAVGLFEPSTIIDPGGSYAVNETLTGGWALPLGVALLGSFGLVTWALIPFGSLVASRFDHLGRIQAYSINIGGSLAGVLLFSLMSMISAPPLAWFGLVCLALALFRPGAMLIFTTTVTLLALGLGTYIETRDEAQSVTWSPYYEIRVRELDPQADRSGGFVVDVNGQFLLSGLNLSPAARVPPNLPPATQQAIEGLKSYYDFPFTLREPGKVLILGSGAGNDVAAAVRAGAEQVTAVEIDPKVMELAHEHPEDPLSHPNVTTVVDDARVVLRDTGQEYDLILFATLDAHGLLSSLGSVRLDSFVYTVESLEAAKARLSPDGIMVLSFGPFREDVQYRQYANVRAVFGQDPLYFIHENDHRTIVAGAVSRLGSVNLPAEWREITDEEITAGFDQYPHALQHSTDDWPHLYIQDRSIPREYVMILVGIALISLLLVRVNLRGTYKVEPTFLFLGAGFLLLETKSVTEFALLIGSTWLTNSLVFSVILGAILIVNLAVLRNWIRLSIPVLFATLGAALMLSYLLPVSEWADRVGNFKILFAAIYLGVPIVLSSAIFALVFRSAVLGTAALASNLVGAVLGGLSEYASLVVGLRALSLLALAMYVAAFLYRRASRVSDPDERILEAAASSNATPRVNAVPR